MHSGFSLIRMMIALGLHVPLPYLANVMSTDGEGRDTSSLYHSTYVTNVNFLSFIPAWSFTTCSTMNFITKYLLSIEQATQYSAYMRFKDGVFQMNLFTNGKFFTKSAFLP